MQDILEGIVEILEESLALFENYTPNENQYADLLIEDIRRRIKNISMSFDALEALGYINGCLNDLSDGNTVHLDELAGYIKDLKSETGRSVGSLYRSLVDEEKEEQRPLEQQAHEVIAEALAKRMYIVVTEKGLFKTICNLLSLDNQYREVVVWGSDLTYNSSVDLKSNNARSMFFGDDKDCILYFLNGSKIVNSSESHDSNEEKQPENDINVNEFRSESLVKDKINYELINEWCDKLLDVCRKSEFVFLTRDSFREFLNFKYEFLNFESDFCNNLPENVRDAVNTIIYIIFRLTPGLLDGEVRGVREAVNNLKNIINESFIRKYNERNRTNV